MKKVIIIGSGLGGLTAGNLLAKRGYAVTLFESHSAPGGYTAGFHRKGYYFESGALSLESSASVFKAMQDIGVLEQLDFVRQRMRYVSADYDAIPENFLEYKKMLYEAFPDEKAKLDRVLAELEEMADALSGMDGPIPNLLEGFAKLKAMLPYLWKGPKLLKVAKRYGEMTSSEYAARYFEKGSKLYNFFGNTFYPDMPAMLLGAVAGMFTDYWTVRSGMQAWADVLAENFRKLGGALILSSYVDKIITRDGAAVGVMSKEAFHQADYVIAAGDYKKTFLQLIDDKSLIPRELVKKVESAAVSEGVFTVYLGLNIANAELEKYLKIPHVLLDNSSPGYDIYDAADAEYFTKAPLTMYAPSLVNPRHAPEGKSSLMLMTTVPYHWLNNWGGGDKEIYKELKAKAAQALIRTASTLVPSLEEKIDFQDAATPLTYERYTHNTDGATSAWSWNPQKRFHKTIIEAHIDTPVRNLFIGSCWAIQIGGIPGALIAAYECVRKIK
ncbi:MAG: NAD(P)/FAD-dependent oxidoreductase [Clostridia bacterium]|nr:NAD(P)/FAD-dependent oxidoreductase [Clostridia bacterium]